MTHAPEYDGGSQSRGESSEPGANAPSHGRRDVLKSALAAGSAAVSLAAVGTPAYAQGLQPGAVPGVVHKP
jgi:hypothetical protein